MKAKYVKLLPSTIRGTYHNQNYLMEIAYLLILVLIIKKHLQAYVNKLTIFPTRHEIQQLLKYVMSTFSASCNRLSTSIRLNL